MEASLERQEEETARPRLSAPSDEPSKSAPASRPFSSTLRELVTVVGAKIGTTERGVPFRKSLWDPSRLRANFCVGPATDCRLMVKTLTSPCFLNSYAAVRSSEYLCTTPTPKLSNIWLSIFTSATCHLS